MLTSKRVYNLILIGSILVGGWYIFEHPEVFLVDTFPLVKEKVASFTKETTTFLQKESKISLRGTSSSQEEIIDEQTVVDATNKERIQEGLPPLGINVLLTQSATKKAQDIISRQYFEHESPDGVGVAELATQAGYTFVIVGENLALGDFVSGQDIVTAWMNSPGHRANIVNIKYKEIGIGVVRGVFEGRTVWVAVQHFGSPRSSCPNIDESLKQDIAILNAELEQQEGEIRAFRARLQAPEAVSQPAYILEINKFNQLVDLYNQGLAESRTLVSTYNEQVRVFNRCISAFQ